MLSEQVVLKCCTGCICVHAAKRMFPPASKRNTECDQSAWMLQPGLNRASDSVTLKLMLNEKIVNEERDIKK